MSASYSIIPVLYLLGAAHGLFLASALFMHRSASRKANLYLGLYTLLFAAALIDYFIDQSGLSRQWIALRILLWPKEFLYGVLIYFYTRELTQPGRHPLRGWQWAHWLPALLHVLLTWPLFAQPAEVQMAVLYDAAPPSEFVHWWSLLLGPVELTLTVIQLTIYLLLSLALIRRHRQRLAKAFSYGEKINLDWLRNILLGTLVVYLIWLADEFVDLNAQINQALDMALGLSMVGLIYSMSLLGLRQTAIFSDRPVAQGAAISEGAEISDEESAAVADISLIEQLEEDERTKYRHSPLTPDMSKALMEELNQVMDSQHPYREPTISLPQLAGQMGLSANYLSQVINQQAGQNFFDFINARRIRDFQQMMREQPDKSVLALSTEVGFNSKSAFYKAFRKHTGTTPGDYKKSLGISG